MVVRQAGLAGLGLFLELLRRARRTDWRRLSFSSLTWRSISRCISARSRSMVRNEAAGEAGAASVTGPRRRGLEASGHQDGVSGAPATDCWGCVGSTVDAEVAESWGLPSVLEVSAMKTVKSMQRRRS